MRIYYYIFFYKLKKLLKKQKVSGSSISAPTTIHGRIY